MVNAGLASTAGSHLILASPGGSSATIKAAVTSCRSRAIAMLPPILTSEKPGGKPLVKAVK